MFAEEPNASQVEAKYESAFESTLPAHPVIPFADDKPLVQLPQF